MNDNEAICKHCNTEKGWHIIPKLNCPGSRDGTYQGGIFFEPLDNGPEDGEECSGQVWITSDDLCANYSNE
jgi:hypothetical protein